MVKANALKVKIVVLFYLSIYINGGANPPRAFRLKIRSLNEKKETIIFLQILYHESCLLKAYLPALWREKGGDMKELIEKVKAKKELTDEERDRVLNCLEKEIASKVSVIEDNDEDEYGRPYTMLIRFCNRCGKSYRFLVPNYCEKCGQKLLDALG